MIELVNLSWVEMEEEPTSMNTSARTNGEGSYSNGRSNNNCQSNKHKTFKGVVLLQNGNWGAQIYANHHRIWLGTFKSDIEAAMAYDSAAIKLRSKDVHRNCPWNNLTLQEPSFQYHLNTETVLKMIKDRTYQSRFQDFLRNQTLFTDNGEYLNKESEQLNNLADNSEEEFSIKLLFHKELTPSDVGKLNRLVIPKKHAVRCFPQVLDVCLETRKSVYGVENLQLVFFDRKMKSWKFRYCYWSSSQSFVFTRGWNLFVKEKELKAKDVITFYQCKCKSGPGYGEPFNMIEVQYSKGESGHQCFVSGLDGKFGIEEGLHINLGLSKESELCKSGVDRWEEKDVDMRGVDSKGVWLFGVQIN